METFFQILQYCKIVFLASVPTFSQRKLIWQICSSAWVGGGWLSLGRVLPRGLCPKAGKRGCALSFQTCRGGSMMLIGCW